MVVSIVFAIFLLLISYKAPGLARGIFGALFLLLCAYFSLKSFGGFRFDFLGLMDVVPDGLMRESAIQTLFALACAFTGISLWMWSSAVKIGAVLGGIILVYFLIIGFFWAFQGISLLSLFFIYKKNFEHSFPSGLLLAIQERTN